MAGAPGPTAGASAWRGMVTEVRGWPAWKQVLAGIACVAGAVWILQAPWRPAIGLLGLLTLATAVLATDLWGLRGRVPLLRSRHVVHVLAGWSLVAGALLLTGAVALAGNGPAAPAREQASPASTRAAAPTPRPPPGTPATVVAAPSPRPTLAPTPSVVPTAPPTPLPTPLPRHGHHSPSDSPAPFN